MVLVQRARLDWWLMGESVMVDLYTLDAVILLLLCLIFGCIIGIICK